MNILSIFGGWIDHLITKKPHQKLNLGPKPENSICIELEAHDYAKLNFEDLFEKEEKCQEIQNKLVTRKMRHPISGKWIDTAKGNKQTLVCVIKKLHILRHFHEHHEMNCFEIQAVCKNSFGKNVSISHIKKIRWDDIILDFIN